MLTFGVEISRAMDHPLAAASLSDFWGCRWNIAFRDFVHRTIFLPLRRRGLAVPLAVMAVFLFFGGNP